MSYETRRDQLGVNRQIKENHKKTSYRVEQKCAWSRCSRSCFWRTTHVKWHRYVKLIAAQKNHRRSRIDTKQCRYELNRLSLNALSYKSFDRILNFPTAYRSSFVLYPVKTHMRWERSGLTSFHVHVVHFFTSNDNHLFLLGSATAGGAQAHRGLECVVYPPLEASKRANHQDAHRETYIRINECTFYNNNRYSQQFFRL